MLLLFEKNDVLRDCSNIMFWNIVTDEEEDEDSDSSDEELPPTKGKPSLNGNNTSSNNKIQTGE